MIVVTATAPRAGTSAMMRALLEHYKPHSYAEAFPEYVAREKNPDGFWDLAKDKLQAEIPYEEGSVIKLWAPSFAGLDTSRVKLLVVMSRSNFTEQVQSMVDCAVAEGLGVLEPKQISQIFLNQKNGIDGHFADTPKIRVDMERFRQDPDEIISYIKEIV